jgi:hypothetical protein
VRDEKKTEYRVVLYFAICVVDMNVNDHASRSCGDENEEIYANMSQYSVYETNVLYPASFLPYHSLIPHYPLARPELHLTIFLPQLNSLFAGSDSGSLESNLDFLSSFALVISFISNSSYSGQG